MPEDEAPPGPSELARRIPGHGRERSFLGRWIDHPRALRPFARNSVIKADAERLRNMAVYCRELAGRECRRQQKEKLLDAADDYERKAGRLERELNPGQ
jgi:hypothetical protein